MPLEYHIYSSRYFPTKPDCNSLRLVRNYQYTIPNCPESELSADTHNMVLRPP